MLKIGEFSKLTKVSIRMLRYYDENNLLKPSKVDEVSGYRYYTVGQIPHLQRILFLRDIGFSIVEMEKALTHWNDDFITKQLKSKQVEIEKLIKSEQNKLSKIEMALKDLKEELMNQHQNFTVKNIPSYPVVSLRKIIPCYFDEGELWEELMKYVLANGIKVTNDTFAIYHDNDFKEQDVDVEVFAVVDHLEESRDGFTYRYSEPVEMMASSMVYGKFENIAGAYLSFAHWLEQHNQYQMLGENRQIVHRGPWNETSPNDYLTEIQIPLQLRKKVLTLTSCEGL